MEIIPVCLMYGSKNDALQKSLHSFIFNATIQKPFAN